MKGKVEDSSKMIKSVVRRFAQEETGAGPLTIEFLGVLPMLLLTIVLFLQFFAFGFTGVSAAGAAHAAARAASIHGCGEAQQAAADATATWKGGRKVSCSGCSPGTTCKIEVKLKVPIFIKGVNIEFPGTSAMIRQPED